jgi:hypothetical protein
MNYICRVKLRENQAPLSVGTTIHSKQNARDIGQFWEKILVAFGDGIRVRILLVPPRRSKQLIH